MILEGDVLLGIMLLLLAIFILLIIKPKKKRKPDQFWRDNDLAYQMAVTKEENDFT